MNPQVISNKPIKSCKRRWTANTITNSVCDTDSDTRPNSVTCHVRNFFYFVRTNLSLLLTQQLVLQKFQSPRKSWLLNYFTFLEIFHLEKLLFLQARRGRAVVNVINDSRLRDSVTVHGGLWRQDCNAFSVALEKFCMMRLSGNSYENFWILTLHRIFPSSPCIDSSR